MTNVSPTWPRFLPAPPRTDEEVEVSENEVLDFTSGAATGRRAITNYNIISRPHPPPSGTPDDRSPGVDVGEPAPATPLSAHVSTSPIRPAPPEGDPSPVLVPGASYEESFQDHIKVLVSKRRRRKRRKPDFGPMVDPDQHFRTPLTSLHDQ